MLGSNNYISIGLLKGGTFTNEKNIFQVGDGGVIPPPEPILGFVLSPPNLEILSQWDKNSTWKAGNVWYR